MIFAGHSEPGPDESGLLRMTLLNKMERRCSLWQSPEANRYCETPRGRKQCLARAEAKYEILSTKS
jgi:hypothetical protein